MSQRFEWQDIEITRGLAFLESIPVVDEDDQPVPEADIMGIFAEIHDTDDLDGVLNTMFDVNYTSGEVPIVAQVSLDESQTLALIAPHPGKVYAWWFLWYENTDSEKVPLKRGRVYVK